MRLNQGHFSFVAFCLTLALIASASADTSTKPHASDTGKIHASAIIIPFQYDASSEPSLVIQVSINHQAPLPFVVDTGASTTLTVDTWAARKLKLPIGKKNMVDVQHGPVAVFDSAVRQMAIVGLHNRKINFGLTIPIGVMDFSYFYTSEQDKPHTVRIAGIIGNELLALTFMAMQIDFIHKNLIFFRDQASDKSVVSSDKSTAVIPLTLDPTDGLYYLNASYGDGRTIKFALDTGSNNTDIPDFYIPLLSSVKVLFNSSGTSIFKDSIRLPKIMFGSLVMHLSFFQDSSPPPIGMPTRIGLDFLSRFLVTIDLLQKRLILQPNEGIEKSIIKQPTSVSPEPAFPQALSLQPAAVPASNVATLGATLGLYNCRLLVSYINTNSPADLCGLKISDEITELNGKEVSHLTDEQILAELNKPEATLMVWRGKTKEWHEFYLVSSYFFHKDAAPPAPPGLPLANQVWEWFRGAGWATTPIET